MNGLTDDEMIFHERHISTNSRRGPPLGNLEDPPVGDAKINELLDKYC